MSDPHLELRSFSDTVGQVLHLSRYLWSDTLIVPCDRETQPLWLEVHIQIRFPDACKLLQVGQDASQLLQVLPDMLRNLHLDADAVRQLRDEGFAEVELAFGPDASVIVELSTQNYAERTLSIGGQAEAKILILQDGSAELIVAEDALVRLAELGGGTKNLQVAPDAHLTIDLDRCEDEE